MDEKFKWQPWIDFTPKAEILPIKSPPCEHCKFWQPMRQYSNLGYEGVVCCLADDMEKDFSCFKANNEEKERHGFS